MTSKGYGLYPAIDAAEAHAIANGRGRLRGCVDGDIVLHLHAFGAYPTELFIGRRGQVYRHPMDERFAPKDIYRIWRATRVAT